MLKKVTVFATTCLIGLCSMSINAQAQEEGGTEEREEVVVAIPDSSNTEIILEENKPETLNDSFRIPAEEIPATKPINNSVAPKVTPATNSTDKVKPKEGKSEVSFNILYYLIYKFKHVDVFGE